MNRALPLLLLCPFAAMAQLALYNESGATQTSVGSSLNMGEVPGGAAKDVRIRAINSGTSAIPVTSLGLSGSGFSIASPLTLPPNVPGGSFLDVDVHFAGGPPAYYTATFQLNTLSVLLQVTALPAPVLGVSTGCTGPDSITETLAFGTVPVGQTDTCGMSLVNKNPQTISVTAVSVSGNGFQLAAPIAVPLTLVAGAAQPLSVNFTPSAAAASSGMLTVSTSSLVQTFPLTGTGQIPQLSLFTVSGSTETALGASYSLGSVAAGNPDTLRIRARNPGSAAIPITSLAISGAGFTITSPPTRPPNIAPGSFLDIYIQFAGGPAGSYSANFQINNLSVLLQLTSVAAATVSALTGCTGPDPSTGVIAFATLQTLQTATCTIALENHNAQSVTVAAVTVSGSGFQIFPAVATPLNIPAGASSSFSLIFSAATAAVYAGVLTVDTQSFPVSGTGVTPPLPAPILSFDSGVSASAQQVNLTMTLPVPSPEAASGSITLAFQPASPLITDDPAVVFVSTGARSVPFTIHPGDTQIALGGQAGAVFQTGTSAGKITFTVTANVAMNGNPTASMTIPPALISIESASAIARSGALDVQLWGFDNTYSAGLMNFTFYDLTGRTIGSGAIPADFTSTFRSYFTTADSGSAFQMLVTFPVTGDASQIGAVDLQLTNTAGSTATQHLTTISDLPDCVYVSASKVVCTPPPDE